MAHASSGVHSTVISPAIRLELGDVLSMRTATNSHESSSSVLDSRSLPPNHHTFSCVGEEEVDNIFRDVCCCDIGAFPSPRENVLGNRVTWELDVSGAIGVPENKDGANAKARVDSSARPTTSECVTFLQI